ncbi:MAG: inositol monophosphatase family protein [Armatimonadota bacterium]
MELHEFITDTARGAGEIILSHYGQINTQRAKEGRGDIVTEVDIESESYILSRIKEYFPDHSIVSEEAGKAGTPETGYTWYIDPLDGTRNYALGIPFFCVSIALAKDGIAEYGVIFDPLHNELFYAAKGQGAMMNNRPVRVSGETDLEDSVISISWLRSRTAYSKFASYIERISSNTSYFRRLGSAALISAYVAAGRIDAYMQGAINPWDIAAGTLLVKEAGGIVTDFAGRPIDLRKSYIDILAATPIIHEKIMLKVLEIKN